MIANGYVNTESTNPSNIANAPHINASIIPSIQNNSFTVNNQINPSRSSVNITPGILTKPQLNIDNVISPIKLLPNIKHDKYVNATIANPTLGKITDASLLEIAVAIVIAIHPPDISPPIQNDFFLLEIDFAIFCCFNISSFFF